MNSPRSTGVQKDCIVKCNQVLIKQEKKTHQKHFLNIKFKWRRWTGNWKGCFIWWCIMRTRAPIGICSVYKQETSRHFERLKISSGTSTLRSYFIGKQYFFPLYYVVLTFDGFSGSKWFIVTSLVLQIKLQQLRRTKE